MVANYTMTLQEINDETLYHWFVDDYPFYVNDEDAKKEFEQKFYDYYFDREIGFETVERYLMKMKGYLNLRMPYYTLLYETILKSKNIEFLLNKDLLETIKHEVKEQGTENQIGTSQVNGNDTQSSTQSSTSESSSTSSSTSTNKESAIRDGVAQATLTDGYLTSTSSGTTSGNDSTESSQNENQSTTTSSSSTGHSQSESNNNRQMTEETTLISRGNIGVTSSAQLLREWRDVLIDMDELIIKDLEFLFMKIY